MSLASGAYHSLLEKACHRFDAENARDPNTELWEGVTHPRELLYAQRLTDWVLKLRPDASIPLRLAARCQHLCRWMIPRATYPMNRGGYLRWRADLKKFHADKAGEVLRAVGWDEQTVGRVQDLNLKQNFPADPDAQTLEDALCLVFLQFQFAELAGRLSDDKMIDALRKCWKKMSAAAKNEALQLTLGPHEQEMLRRALAGPR